MLQHNLDLTGGTSGSAIFDHRGFIIAVNFAGYYRLIFGLDRDGMDIRRYLVPVALGLAIRVDEVWAMVDLIDAEVPTPPARAYPFDSYQAFPENWNGVTRGPE